MYGVTWQQVRNLLQNILSAAGGFLIAKYPSVDWPLIGGIIMNIAAIVWTVRTGQKDVVVSDAANLKSWDGSQLIRSIEINPRSEEATQLANATPDNVRTTKGN